MFRLRVEHALVHRAEQLGQLVGIEPGHGQVHALGAELLQLGRQQLEVPGGVERELVVGDAKETLLALGEAGEDHRRDLGHSELLSGLQAAVAGDQRTGPA